MSESLNRARAVLEMATSHLWLHLRDRKRDQTVIIQGRTRNYLL